MIAALNQENMPVLANHSSNDVMQNPCAIRLSDLEIPLESLADTNQEFILANGLACSVSFVAGSLQIRSNDCVDVVIHGSLAANAIHIKTQGVVRINTFGESLRPTQGMSVLAAGIFINAPIENCPDLNLSTNLVCNGTIMLLKSINATNTVFRAAKIHLIKNLDSAYMQITSAYFKQHKNSHINLPTGGAVAENSWITSTDMTLCGSIKGDGLIITCTAALVLRGKIYGDNLRLKARFAYGAMASMVDGVTNLVVNVDYMFTLGVMSALNISQEGNILINLGGAIEGTVKLKLNNFVTFIGMGAQLRGTNIAVLGGLYLNLLGVVRKFNFSVDCIFSRDFGLTIPCIPYSLESITNTQKVIVALRLIAKNVYKPVGSVFKIAYKLYSIADKLQKVNERYQTHPKMDTTRANLNILNALLALKAVCFAVRDVYEEKEFVEKCASTLSGNTAFNEPPPTLEHTYKNVLHHAMPAFLPAYVVDSLHSVSGGYVYTGVRAEVNLVHEDRSETRSLYPLPS